MTVSGKDPSNRWSLDKPIAPHGGACLPRTCALPAQADSTLSAHTWFGLSQHGTSRLPPCLGWDGMLHLCSPPLPFGFRAKSQSCLCCRRLCCSLRNACPHSPGPGTRAGLPGHLTARRCPQAVGAAGDSELGGVAWCWGWGVASLGSPWLPLTDGRACVGWRGGGWRGWGGTSGRAHPGPFGAKMGQGPSQLPCD